MFAGDIVMSVPCYLYGTILNTDGCLHVYKDRLDFVNKEGEMVRGSGWVGWGGWTCQQGGGAGEGKRVVVWRGDMVRGSGGLVLCVVEGRDGEGIGKAVRGEEQRLAVLEVHISVLRQDRAKGPGQHHLARPSVGQFVRMTVTERVMRSCACAFSSDRRAIASGLRVAAQQPTPSQLSRPVSVASTSGRCTCAHAAAAAAAAAQVHSVPMDCIEQIGQRPVPKLNSATGSLLTLQVRGKNCSWGTAGGEWQLGNGS